MKAAQKLLGIFVVAIIFFSFISGSAFAQSNVNEVQGLKPHDSMHGGDLDSVSLTNGGLEKWLSPLSRQITKRSFSNFGRCSGIAHKLPLRTSSVTADCKTRETPKPALPPL